MKKILVASTAMALLGGAAVAEVKTTADGRMGVVYQKEGTAKGAWNFTSRFRVTFTASGQTDGGLAFGGTIRADNAVNGAGSSGFGQHGGSVYISGAFGKLELGDVDSAGEKAVGDLFAVGLVDAEWDDFYYVGAAASSQDPVVLYTYTFGDTSVYASLNDGRTGVTNAKGSSSYGLGVKHKFGDYTIAAGYERTQNVTLWDSVASSGAALSFVDKSVLAGAPTAKADLEQFSIGGTAKFGDLTVMASYHKINISGLTAGTFDGSPTQYGLGASYKADALTVGGFYRVIDVDYAGIDNTIAYGVGATYDLGGGASVVGGYSSIDNGVKSERFSAGISFTF